MKADGESEMSVYKTFTTVTDFGPYITKLILKFNRKISKQSVKPEDFRVQVRRRNPETKAVILTKEFFRWDDAPEPAEGERQVYRAYPCDSMGNYCDAGDFVALEMGTDNLGKKIEGTIDSSIFTDNEYTISFTPGDGQQTPELVFDQCAGDICPQLEGWRSCESLGEGRLGFGYYTPEVVRCEKTIKEKLPLLIWLHGAGEGGNVPEIAYTGNKVVNLSSADIQKKFGNGAWILVPQCPTVWMDDGKEQLGRSNQSIYTEPLKRCIDEFIRDRQDQIDSSRIWLGGCSNGGFMTVRMAVDYPHTFAAIFPVCEAFFTENITEDVIRKLKDMPCWFVHAKGDRLVNPQETAIPLYQQLISSGADNVHMTYFDNMDEEARKFYKNNELLPHLFDHGVWVRVYNDKCTTDFDGQPVMANGRPVTLFEWLGKQKRPDMGQIGG